MDDNSLTISYDYIRGEPRRNKADDISTEGDCIDCYRCVAVCPTGIDIRDGLQMECIACTACIDACDEVMIKVNKPKGLIRYDTIRGISGLKSRSFSGRRIIYLGLIIVLFGGLSYLISIKEDYLITILRAKDKPYSLVQNDVEKVEIINHFKVHLKNQTFQNADIMIALPENVGEEGISLITQKKILKMNSGMDRTAHFFIKFPPETLNDSGNKILNINFIDALNNKIIKEKEVNLVGPISDV